MLENKAYNKVFAYLFLAMAVVMLLFSLYFAVLYHTIPLMFIAFDILCPTMSYLLFENVKSISRGQGSKYH